MTTKNNRAPPLCYVKVCPLFQSHQWIQTGSYSSETLNSGKNWWFFFSRVTLKCDGWPWKTIWHLFYATLSFVHHFKTINELKLELQSGNAQFRSKSAFFLSYVTLKFDGWPQKTIGHLVYVTSRFVHHFVAICEFKMSYVSETPKLGQFFLISMTLTFDLWPWWFAWTSLCQW